MLGNLSFFNYFLRRFYLILSQNHGVLDRGKRKRQPQTRCVLTNKNDIFTNYYLMIYEPFRIISNYCLRILGVLQNYRYYTHRHMCRYIRKIIYNSFDCTNEQQNTNLLINQFIF